MNEIPLIDWNGNGCIDPNDVALTLAMQEAAEQEEEEDAPCGS